MLFLPAQSPGYFPLEAVIFTSMPDARLFVALDYGAIVQKEQGMLTVDHASSVR